jgi:hypothetical protein
MLVSCSNCTTTAAGRERQGAEWHQCFAVATDGVYLQFGLVGLLGTRKSVGLVTSMSLVC